LAQQQRHAPPPREISDEALRWIVRLNSGSAGPQARADYAAWRALSPAHAQAAREAEAIWGDAGNLHLDADSGAVRPGRSKRGPSRRAVIACGVALAALGGAGLATAHLLQRPDADYLTATAETLAVTLPDGSRVHLGARSALDLDFSAARRDVALIEGRAYFEVATDAARPFSVAVAGTRVTALGTAFDIDATLPAGAVEIAVTEHAVRLSTGLDLQEGQGLRIDGAGRRGPVTAIDPAVVEAWRDGLYIAENRTLEDVIAALGAWRQGWIVIQSPRLAALRVNAVLDLRRPDAALDVLAAALPITVRGFSPFLTVISEI
jgi:transmembrane sensor